MGLEADEGCYISGPKRREGRATVTKENIHLLQKTIWKVNPSPSTRRFNVLASEIQETHNSKIPSSFIQKQLSILYSNNSTSDAGDEGYQEVGIQRPL